MLAIVEDFIPEGRRNRPGGKMKPEWITVHDTANPGAGSDALAHARYLKGDTAAAAPVSWHFTVDDRRAVQHLPIDEMAYHAGDGGSGPGNTTSIGIEICENSNGDRPTAEANAGVLLSLLLWYFGWNTSRVVPHKRWTGKECPHLLLPRWDAFVTWIGDLLPGETRTPIIGEPRVSWLKARKWARLRGATQQFIELAPIYWRIGAEYGVRPEVLYAQAAKETAFGRFGGSVTPEMHNFAGIKVENPTGDARADHEAFENDEDGVRHHYIHMCAYTGLAPMHDPHPRYYVVLKQPWAGAVTQAEDLGGKWAPFWGYGLSIIDDYLHSMLETRLDWADVRREIETARRGFSLLPLGADERTHPASQWR